MRKEVFIILIVTSTLFISACTQQEEFVDPVPGYVDQIYDVNQDIRYAAEDFDSEYNDLVEEDFQTDASITVGKTKLENMRKELNEIDEKSGEALTIISEAQEGPLIYEDYGTMFEQFKTSYEKYKEYVTAVEKVLVEYDTFLEYQTERKELEDLFEDSDAAFESLVYYLELEDYDRTLDIISDLKSYTSDMKEKQEDMSNIISLDTDKSFIDSFELAEDFFEVYEEAIYALKNEDLDRAEEKLDEAGEVQDKSNSLKPSDFDVNEELESWFTEKISLPLEAAWDIETDAIRSNTEATETWNGLFEY